MPLGSYPGWCCGSYRGTGIVMDPGLPPCPLLVRSSSRGTCCEALHMPWLRPIWGSQQVDAGIRSTSSACECSLHNDAGPLVGHILTTDGPQDVCWIQHEEVASEGVATVTCRQWENMDFVLQTLSPHASTTAKGFHWGFLQVLLNTEKSQEAFLDSPGVCENLFP